MSIDSYTRRALFAAAIGIIALVLLLLGGNPAGHSRELQAADRMAMSDAAMSRWVHDFYNSHPVRGVVPAAANVVIADTFLVHSFYFDTDNNAGTQVDTSRIHVGDRILFKWADGFHTATSGDPNDLVNAGLIFDLPMDPSDVEAAVQFNTPGTFPFFCRPHGSFFNMRGVIVVTPNATGVPPTTGRTGIGFVAAPWPNPTAHGATFRFALPRAGQAHVAAYDASGRLVAHVLDGEMGPGEFAGTWDGRAAGRAAAPGVYYLRLTAPGVHASARLVVSR